MDPAGDQYDGFPSGRVTLLEGPELDRAFARHGLRPLRPTETVERETESGRRVTANALYVKP